MPLLTPAQVREHLSTGLSDDALTQMIAAEEADLSERWGPPQGPVLDVRFGGGSLLTLRRPAVAVTEARETRYGVEAALPPAGYELWPSGRVLARLGASWGERVTVTYTPQDDTSARILSLLGLIGAELHRGIAAESFDDWRASYDRRPTDEQRDELIGRLHQRSTVIA